MKTFLSRVLAVSCSLTLAASSAPASAFRSAANLRVNAAFRAPSARVSATRALSVPRFSAPAFAARTARLTTSSALIAAPAAVTAGPAVALSASKPGLTGQLTALAASVAPRPASSLISGRAAFNRSYDLSPVRGEALRPAVFAASLGDWPTREQNLRRPRPSERAKIEFAIAEIKRRTGHLERPLLAPALQEFENQIERHGGRFLVSDDQDGRYHVRSAGSAYRNATVIPSSHMFAPRGITGVFLGALLGREAFYFTEDWGWDDPTTGRRENFPPAYELLVASYASAVLGWAQASNSNSKPNRWAIDLDHDHEGQGKRWMWEYYYKLLDTLKAPFADSAFARHIRDFTAREMNRDPAFQFALWERFDGHYDRPEDPVLNGQPVPAQVLLLDSNGRPDTATYNAAAKKFYGVNPDGSNDNKPRDVDTNFLGLMRNALRELESR